MKNSYFYILKISILKKVSAVWLAETCSLGILLIFQILSGRLLDSSDYGLFATFYGLVTLATAVSHGLRISMARTTVIELSDNGNTSINLFGLTMPMVIVFFVALGICLFSKDIGQIINSQSRLHLLIMVCNLPILVLIAALIGSIQGRKLFHIYCMIILVQAISRLIFTALFTTFDNGIDALLWAVLLSNVSTLLLLYFFCRDLLNIDGRTLFPTYVSDSVPALIAHLIVSLHSSVDILLARYLLSDADSGNFVVITLFGRMMFYFPMAMWFVFLPIMVEKFQNNKDIRKFFVMFVLLYILVSTISGTIINFSSDFLTGFLWGHGYDVPNAALLIYCTAILVLGINYQFMQAMIIVKNDFSPSFCTLLVYFIGFSVLPLYANSIITISGGVLMVNLCASLPLIIFTRQRVFNLRSS